MVIEILKLVDDISSRFYFYFETLKQINILKTMQLRAVRVYLEHSLIFIEHSSILLVQ